ncbi:hypothetical protein [uncultured Bifidobacterium sp.]|uniref:hypothetical protein n=1 Tax=uncultured Bifidobacterium sp. TaxID=165187 RepID=UPI0027DDFF95|nr:hypothetical protein [uncultured Bifidobacterium sp.]
MKYRLYWSTDADGLMHPHLNMRGSDDPLWRELPLNGTVAVPADCRSVLCRDVERFILDAHSQPFGTPDDEWLFDSDAHAVTNAGIPVDGVWRNGSLTVPVVTLPFGAGLGDMDDECRPRMPLLSTLIRILREEGLEDAGRRDALNMANMLTDDTALRAAAHRYITEPGKETDK